MSKKTYINITVNGYIAVSPKEKIVCDNKNYRIKFHFSEEWDNVPVKTARFVYKGILTEKPFKGDEVDAPPVIDANMLLVGVYAGDLQTTTPAIVECLTSIRGAQGAPQDPPLSIYDKIIELINNLQIEKGKPSDAVPLMDGEATAGVAMEYSREDHVHPTDTTRASAEALENLRKIVDKKQNKLAFDGEYNADTNKVATERTVINKVAEIISGAPEDFDTLKELADYLATHGIEAAEMNSAIKEAGETANKAKIIAEGIDDIAKSALNIANTSLVSSQRADTNAEDAQKLAREANTISKETQTALATEIDRAKKAEETNAQNLAAHISAYNEKVTSLEQADQSNADAIEEFERRVNALLSSDDTTLDQLQEIVDYIKNNKDLIDGITTSKVNVYDIVDNLLSSATNKPLSANQGGVLKGLIDALTASLNEHKTAHEAKVSELANADTTNADAIAKETERAKASEEANAKDISEVNKRIDSTNEWVGDIESEIGDLLSSKQDNLSFEDEYNSETNKVATLATVTKKIAEIIANAPEDFNTLKELADWLETHGTEAAKMNSDIKANANAITTETNRATAAEKALASQLANAGIHSDYSEDDTESKAHILNRPFYDAVIATADSIEDEGITYSYHRDPDGYIKQLSSRTVSRDELFAEGAEYKIEGSSLDSSLTETITETFTLSEDKIVQEDESGIVITIFNESREYTLYIVYDYTEFSCEVYNGTFIASSNGIYYYDESNYRHIKITRLYRDEVSELKRLDNKFLDLPNNEDFNKKQDKLVNSTGFEVVPVIKRNSDTIEYWLVSPGVGGRIVARTVTGTQDIDGNTAPSGNIVLPKETDIPDKGDFAISVDKANKILEDYDTIEGINIPTGEAAKIFNLLNTESNDYGLYLIMGEDVRVAYNALVDGVNTPIGITSSYHFLIFDKVKDKSDTTGSTIVNRILHLHQGTLTMTSKDYELVENSSVFVYNNSSRYGTRIHKISLKPIFKAFPLS